MISKSSQNKKIVLASVISLFLCMLILSSCSLPNNISNYMDSVNNNGKEKDLMNSDSHLDMLFDKKIDNERSAYPDSSDEVFANFKAVDALGLKTNLIYRCASPIDPSSQRCTYADKFLEQNNIKNIINLEDTQEIAKSYPNFNNTYYSKQYVLYAPVDEDLTTQQSKDSICNLIYYIKDVEGPIAIHCKDGAKKTGLVCALLQALNVSGYDYLKAEYIKAYLNLYNSNVDLTEPINMRFRNELSKTLNLTSHNILYSNLNKYANLYFDSCKICKQDLEQVKNKLKADI